MSKGAQAMLTAGDGCTTARGRHLPSKCPNPQHDTTSGFYRNCASGDNNVVARPLIVAMEHCGAVWGVGNGEGCVRVGVGETGTLCLLLHFAVNPKLL